MEKIKWEVFIDQFRTEIGYYNRVSIFRHSKTYLKTTVHIIDISMVMYKHMYKIFYIGSVKLIVISMKVDVASSIFYIICTTVPIMPN